jgi:ABC-2 type transport system permease protein
MVGEMVNNVQLYWDYVKFYFRSQSEYRANFLVGNAANFYTYFLVYANFWILTQKFGSLGGWTFDEVSLLYSLNLLTYALAGILFWYSIYHLEEAIIRGDLDRYLVRPRGVITQLVCQQFGFSFMGQVLAVLTFLIPCLARLPASQTPGKWLYLGCAVLGGCLLQAGAVILVGALSFWITRTLDIGDVFYYSLRGFVNYPLNMFPAFIQIGLTFVFPWAFINYYPALILLNKARTAPEIVLGWLAPLVGLLFFLFSLKIFHSGLKRYTSAGH